MSAQYGNRVKTPVTPVGAVSNRAYRRFKCALAKRAYQTLGKNVSYRFGRAGTCVSADS